ncbi:MAG: rod shape-determining protein [Firmicutes bacterium]|nr:rod shape-determining protein [Candidatus Fermentithermobacillaceae bacterium]
MGGRNVGIDLGTSSVLVFVSGKGIVLREPSVIARHVETKEVLAVGTEARRMVGRTPGSIVTVSPLVEGVINDFEVTEIMLRYFLRKSLGSTLVFKPTLLLCVPAAVTSVERRAVLQAGLAAGGKKVYLIEEPLAAALGAGIDITAPKGHMVVDIGGGTTDIAVLSLNGIVTGASTRVGGNAFDEAIIRHMRREYTLFIGESTAEEVKIAVGSAHPEANEETRYEVRGRDAITGLPRSVSVSSADIRVALREPLDLICHAIRQVLDRTPPELLGDIIDKGIVLTGGGALLKGITQLIRDATGLPVHVAEDPISCVARGTIAALENFNLYREHIESLTG